MLAFREFLSREAKKPQILIQLHEIGLLPNKMSDSQKDKIHISKSDFWNLFMFSSLPTPKRNSQKMKTVKNTLLGLFHTSVSTGHRLLLNLWLMMDWQLQTC